MHGSEQVGRWWRGTLMLLVVLVMSPEQRLLAQGAASVARVDSLRPTQSTYGWAEDKREIGVEWRWSREEGWFPQAIRVRGGPSVKLWAGRGTVTALHFLGRCPIAEVAPAVGLEYSSGAMQWVRLNMREAVFRDEVIGTPCPTVP